MATYTVRTVGQAGSTPAPVAVSSSDNFANDGRTFLRVTNGGGSSINVTFNSIQPCNQGSDHDLVVAVPNGATREIGPFDPTRFNDPSTGLLGVAYSATTSVTAEAIRTP